MFVSVDVTNVGQMDSDEVAQLYLTHPGIEGAPLRALKGFERVHLVKGQKMTLSFKLRDRDLSIVDEKGAHRIVAGEVKVWVGGGQPLSRSGRAAPAGIATKFTLSDNATLPR